MSGFIGRPDGGASADFHLEEVKILTDLATQFVDLIENRGETGSDPALDRLLPDAYRDNADNAAEFRRFTEVDLATRKVRNARLVLATISAKPKKGTVTATLDPPAVQAWLRSLTDVRLTLASRLQIDQDGTLPAGTDDMAVAVYEWLGYLQESLVEAIDY